MRRLGAFVEGRRDLHVAPRARQERSHDLEGAPSEGERLQVARVREVRRRHRQGTAPVLRTEIDHLSEERSVARDLGVEDLVQIDGEIPELALGPSFRGAHGEAPRVLLQVEDVLLQEESELVQRQGARGELGDERVLMQGGPDRLALFTEEV